MMNKDLLKDLTSLYIYERAGKTIVAVMWHGEAERIGAREFKEAYGTL